MSDETDNLSDDDFRELHSLWLSRLMLNPFVGWHPETRSFEEFVTERLADSDWCKRP